MISSKYRALSAAARLDSRLIKRSLISTQSTDQGIPPPLTGIRVLDLTRVLAGPSCTMLLADMGADVIKVEEVTRGDDTREWPVLAYPSFIWKKTGSWLPPSAAVSLNSPKESLHLPPESAYFLAVNRNKRSITVNFKDPAGLEVMQRLVRTSDVLVENFIAGKLAGMGLGWEDCKVLNPRLVYASITGLSELTLPDISIQF